MIKSILNKSFSVTLALLVLFSTVSFTVEKHFCGDVLVDVSVFTEVQKCAMEAFEMEQTALTKKSCCKDQVDVIQGQDELKFSSFEDLNFDQQNFLTTFAQSYINLFEGLPQLFIPHKDYSPPDLFENIQVLHDTFLI